MKPRWLDRRIGFAGPFLALCLNEAEFRAELIKLKMPSVPRWVSEGADATTHYLRHEGHKLCCVVCLSEKHSTKTGIEIAGLLIHEAVHVWQEWCDDCGEHRPGSEQEAYAIQTISQELMAEFARRTAR